jgi:hypothetical protein
MYCAMSLVTLRLIAVPLITVVARASFYRRFKIATRAVRAGDFVISLPSVELLCITIMKKIYLRHGLGALTVTPSDGGFVHKLS